MLTWKWKLATALLLLIGVGVCLRAGASGSDKKEPPGKSDREAALEQAWRDWRELEQKQIRDHIDARRHLAECNAQMLKAQTKLDETQRELLRIRKMTKGYRPGMEGPNEPAFKQMLERQKSLEDTEQQDRLKVKLAEKNHMRTEESLQALEREQALRRDLLRTRFQAADGRLHPQEEGEQGSWQRIERRLQEMDRKLERLDSELSKLRRQMESGNPKS